jgi:hypothetical protein
MDSTGCKTDNLSMININSKLLEKEVHNRLLKTFNQIDMKRLIIYFSVITFFLLLFVSCYYDNEEALYPTLNTSCDTINVTFSGVITPILNNNCFSCHSNSTAAGNGNNIPLQNYADVVSRVASVIGSIKHTGSYSPMPKNGGTISSCALSQFEIWIKKGMLNN